MESRKILQAFLGLFKKIPLRIIGFIVLGVLLLVFMVILMRGCTSKPGDTGTSAGLPGRRDSDPTVQQDLNTPFPDPLQAAHELDPAELVIPNEIEYFWNPGWIQQRPRRTQWTLEDIEQFWVDPITVGTDTLSEQNRQRYFDLLMEID